MAEKPTLQCTIFLGIFVACLLIDITEDLCKNADSWFVSVGPIPGAQFCQCQR